MRIAVASQNFRTVTPHVGRTRRFFIFEATPGAPAQEVERLDMPRGMALHDFKGPGDHPLYSVDAIIAASVGRHFVQRMARMGITAAATSEPDPAAAARALVEGCLPPPAPHEHDEAGCSHD
ncbi:NifB/NifX family molybdenum-iron cluster-binding protein [Rhodovulum adriaticum]|uniref:Putative Fe-Mo cluster-binding NifX family protein n=1 Tax=Rhodovulum adriaticum TaxID=35804 RepID=A0A4R2NL63_RHOAD|nr:NifB/NifX family molybdenum-iron cluster-binding protein [Rhodovulum adriaticum]MBK1637025.1 nitrogen fixation protein [Rhodovulum adriaticum]TCP22005.1 putative Fe-Mo cluster-binding NifX family protein [Rhodovulum adriaticum]